MDKKKSLSSHEKAESQLSEKNKKIVDYLPEDILIPDDLDFDDSDFEDEMHVKKKPKLTSSNGTKIKSVPQIDNVSPKKTIKQNPPSQPSNSNDYIDQNDTALMSSLLSSFSDSGSQTTCPISEKTVPKTNNSKSPDSGTETLENELNDEDIPDFFEDWDEEKTHDLNLEDFLRVRVIQIEEKKLATQLIVEDPVTKSTAVVNCLQSWYRLKVSVGDYITIKAIKSSVTPDWTINNDHGFCVTNTDTLVTGTSVVGSLFCGRQGVLQTKLSGLNMIPGLKPKHSSLTLGSIVHELLQAALSENIFELKDLSQRFEKILKKPSIVIMLYASQLTHKEIRTMAEEYVSAIHDFMHRYVKGSQPKTDDDNFNGRIIEVKDIEESVYLPKLGLKGKIDVTVGVKMNGTFGGKRVMPLEIKTGKATLLNMSHRGQLNLYCMMLNILGTKVDGGLLLYIKDNSMKEILTNRNEDRGLILMRNAMAYYLSKIPEVNQSFFSDGNDKTNNIAVMDLPEPINHSYCNKCPYNTMCCVYASRDPEISLPDNHPVKKLSEILFQDVTENHIDYVLNWIAMLEIEEGEKSDLASSRHIWTTKPIIREKRRLCISHLKVTKTEKTKDGFIYRFERSMESLKPDRTKFPVDDFREVFSQYDVITISTDTRIHLASGTIIKIDANEMIINFDKDITKWNFTGVFHVDSYPYVNRTNRLLGSVATLLSDNPVSRKLRKIIIDKEPATFNTEIPKQFHSDEVKKIRHDLNELQDAALKAVVQADDYILIKGMPGTGKTHLIVALIEVLIVMGKTVLVSAHTHTAVNNIMLKLIEKNIDFLRIGKTSKIHPLLMEKSDDALMKNCDTPEMLEIKFGQKKVVGVTCLTADHGLLSKRVFDYCIVDECSQALQPILLRPLFNADKMVFIGDPEQLPPIVVSRLASKCGMTEDIFSRLDTPNNTRVLSLQYRMNDPIMELANELTYNGELRAGNESVAKSTYKIEDEKIINKSENWIKKTLSTELIESVIMLNTGPTHRKIMDKFMKKNGDESLGDNDGGDGEDDEGIDDDMEQRSCSNICEASIVVKLVDILIKSGVKLEDIGIISPYRAQINLLKCAIKDEIEINTVDQYQGRDKSIILFTFAKSDIAGSKKKVTDEYEILQDHRRLNVALTRAKHKLVVIGDVGSIERFTPVEKMIKSLDSKGKIMKLKDGVDDFSWNKLLAGIEDVEIIKK